MDEILQNEIIDETVPVPAPASRKTTDLHSAFLAVYGLLIVVLLIAAACFHLYLPDETYSASEKRSLKSLPALSLSSLLSVEWMEEIEEYLSDQFPGRDAAMRIKSGLSLYLGETDSNGVYYCRDGSLMTAFQAYDEALLQKTADAVGDFADRYEFRSRIFLLIPSAVSLNAEALPLYAESASEEAYIAAFRERLAGSVTAPDTQPLLQALKEAGEKVYYRTDHHWTSGAAYGLFTALANDFGWQKSDLQAVTVSDHFLGSLVSKSGFAPPEADELTAYLDPDPAHASTALHTGETAARSGFYYFEKLGTENEYEFFLGGNEPLITVQTTADTEDTLLVFKDSYANCFLPFLAQSYKTITIVDPRYYTEPVSSLFLQRRYTDVLFLYNVQNLAEDQALSIVLSDEGT